MKTRMLTCVAALAATSALAETHSASGPLDGYGPRPAYLISQMQDGPLKDALAACEGQQIARTDFSIGHRGAPLMFPEHTVEANRAAAGMGAGILECDVTFTADHALVCRHAQNDLHTTTNILATDLAEKCTAPFTPADGDTPASAECRTSDLTLAEFQTLRPKMDAADSTATTVEAYLGGTADWRTNLYDDNAQLMTHAESIALFADLGAKFTPELKSASVPMPDGDFTQEDYAQKLVDEYVAAGVDPADVWLQSFNLDDVKYWIANTPDFGAQAVYLDDRYEASDDDEGAIDPLDTATFQPTMQELADMGVNYIAPPLWMLITLDDAGQIVPSPYATAAKDAGLNIIAWSYERSGPLATGGGWYFQSVADAISSDGDYYEVLDVLAQDVGIEGMFSDWPATVTYYANCMGL
ncbi:glycerophosphoryl diester phosphodiesterase [Loktanella sp. DSM 29012]|uniref:glycerophosphodiester phosphodiesterase family protein n=1 Tax=Loktanella sp. DSM 29012 TaxID=1881056 RepID=UPI0008D1C56A|nr:glycerophosphodiester phosphodiesterase family protein [Loktanella sp. DSM 29012]SEQ68585.1 glycerophosphoryl diester phosphodiesterase [Loktanella sp. DSM 29012]